MFMLLSMTVLTHPVDLYIKERLKTNTVFTEGKTCTIVLSLKISACPQTSLQIGLYDYVAFSRLSNSGRAYRAVVCWLPGNQETRGLCPDPLYTHIYTHEGVFSHNLKANTLPGCCMTQFLHLADFKCRKKHGPACPCILCRHQTPSR